MYEHNQFNDATTRQFDHRMSSYISFTITLNDKVKLVNTLYFQPLLNTLGHARVASQGSLIISFTKRLVYRSTASLTFDNDTRLPPSVPDLTYTWTNGIRWEFGK